VIGGDAAAVRKLFDEMPAFARQADVGDASRRNLARNAPCPCASGRRFKSCCGAVVLQELPSCPERVRDRLWRALALQRSGQLNEARALYEEVLRDHADVPDAVHMLGVILLQTGHYREALHYLAHAAQLFDWSFAALHHNLGLALAAELGGGKDPATFRVWRAYDEMLDRRRGVRRDVAPRISVVVPSFNHAEYVESALESIFVQAYPSIEIIVIDDGSSDDSAHRILVALRHSPFPWRFHARGNRGAAETINQAVASSNGEFVNILNSDDRFAASRLTNMVDSIARTGEQWGFSRVALIDRDGATIGAQASLRAAELCYLTDNVGARDSVGFSFLSGNPSISSGALFFARSIFDRIGGFRDFRYNHDWDFCLRASLVAEPVFVSSAEYDYRVHASNTILESTADAQREVDAMFKDFHRHVHNGGDTANRFAPVPQVWGDRFYEQALASGHAGVMPPATLRVLSDRAMAQSATEQHL
jgi:glycosyltransferase involved in cell wall biosynthesis